MSKRVETYEDVIEPSPVQSPPAPQAQGDEISLTAPSTAPTTALSSQPFAAWVPVVTLGIADWILADHDGLAFVGWTSVILAVAFLGSITLFYGITGRSRRLSDAAHYAALWLAFSAVGVVFTYLMADLRMPLWDARFARMDAALGFDWPAWFSLVAAHRPLKYLLEVAYSSLLPQIIFSIIYLSHIGRPERNDDLLWASFASLFVISMMSAVTPALGACVYFHAFRPDYLTDLLALRDGAISRFVLGDMKGLVQMPSFHTALAILFAYAHRPPVRSFTPVALLNILMLLSLPSEGGHYLVDMIAGAAIAVLSIAIVKVAKHRIGVPAPTHDSAERLTSAAPRTESFR